LHVLLEGVSLSSVGLVPLVAVLAVEFPLLGQFVCVSGVDCLDLVDVGFLALSVQLVQVVDGLPVLLLGFESKHFFRLQLLLQLLDLAGQLFLVALVVARLRRQALLGGLQLLLKFIACGLGRGKALVV